MDLPTRPLSQSVVVWVSPSNEYHTQYNRKLVAAVPLRARLAGNHIESQLHQPQDYYVKKRLGKRKPGASKIKATVDKSQ